MDLFSMLRRPPNVVIQKGNEGAYLRRWHIIPRNRWFNIYLHHFNKSDDDRALHDHPWINLSIILKGTYLEHTFRHAGLPMTRRRRRVAGGLVFRLPTTAHRIELDDGPCWTLFLTGPKVREWGFHCPNGWVHWTKFLDEDGNGIGAGCE